MPLFLLMRRKPTSSCYLQSLSFSSQWWGIYSPFDNFFHGSSEGNSHGSDLCDFSFIPLHLLSPTSLFSNVYPIIHLVKCLKCLVINSLYLKEYHILSSHNGDSMVPINVHNVTFFPDTSPGTSFPIPCFCHIKWHSPPLFLPVFHLYIYPLLHSYYSISVPTFFCYTIMWGGLTS